MSQYFVKCIKSMNGKVENVNRWSMNNLLSKAVKRLRKKQANMKLAQVIVPKERGRIFHVEVNSNQRVQIFH